MGAIARVFNVRPFELHLLTVWEFYHLCTLIDQLNS